MICRIVRKLLPLHAGGDLGGRTARRLNRHLGRCAGCAAEYRALRTARQMARNRADEERLSLPDDFAARVRRRVSAGTREEHSHPAFRRYAPWAAAALLLLAAIGLLREGRDADEVAPKEAAVETRPDAIMPVEVEDLTPGQLAALMSRLNPCPELTDEELEARYPLVESLAYPEGTQVTWHLDDPKTRVIWILPSKGDQL